jgi:acetyltransferase
MQQHLADIARDSGMRILGPNCLGLIRPDIGLNITFGHNNARAGNLALVSQSGAICTATARGSTSSSSASSMARPVSTP